VQIPHLRLLIERGDRALAFSCGIRSVPLGSACAGSLARGRGGIAGGLAGIAGGLAGPGRAGGEEDPHVKASGRPGPCVKRGAVRGRDRSRDRQAEPGSAGGRSPTFHPPEGLEQGRQQHLLYASGRPIQVCVRTSPASMAAVQSVLPATADPAAPQDVAVANPADS